MSRNAPRARRAARVCAGVLLSTLAFATPGRAAQLTLAITHSPSTLAVDVAVDQGYFAAEGVAGYLLGSVSSRVMGISRIPVLLHLSQPA